MESWGPPDLGVTARRRGGRRTATQSGFGEGRLAGLLQGVLPGGRTWHTASLERTPVDETAGARAGAWDRSTAAGSQVVALRRSEGRERKHRGHISRLQGSQCVEGPSSWWTGLRGQGTLVDPWEHGLSCKKERTDRE